MIFFLCWYSIPLLRFYPGVGASATKEVPYHINERFSVIYFPQDIHAIGQITNP